jgi:hypothetical protein
VLEKLVKIENELKATLSPVDFQKVSQITNRAAEGTHLHHVKREIDNRRSWNVSDLSGRKGIAMIIFY